jgi:hypothetical protein
LDPVSVAGVAAVLLATRGGEGFAEEAGKGAWSALVKMTNLVRGKARRDRRAQAALQLVEQRPSDPAGVAALTVALAHLLQSDPGLCTAVTALVAQARSDPAVERIVIEVSGDAHVGKITTIAGPVHGDVFC